MARRRRRRQHGKGSVYQTASGLWSVRWRENGRRQARGGYPDRETAERVLAKVFGQVAQNRAGMPPDPSTFPTLAEEAERWHARRKLTHRAAYDDRIRWDRHLRPHFGHLRPAEVDKGRIRAFVEAKLAEGLNPATIGHCVRLLSTFFSDLCEREHETGVSANPVHSVSKPTRRLMKPTHDSRDTPFLESLSDVRRVFQALPEPFSVAFAVGAFAGLRTGEVLGLEWGDVDLARGRIRVHQQVQDSRLGPLKDSEPRTVQVQTRLAPVLAAYRLKTGGEGLLFKPDRPGRRAGRNGTPSTFMRPNTLHAALREALKNCKLPVSLTWYQCTRHTFASQWVAAGGSLEKLADQMGHASTWVTERYAHVRPEHFRDADRRLLDVDLGSTGEVVPMLKPGEVDHRLTTDPEAAVGDAAASV